MEFHDPQNGVAQACKTHLCLPVDLGEATLQTKSAGHTLDPAWGAENVEPTYLL